jgi:DNA-binding protein HU-beta
MNKATLALKLAEKLDLPKKTAEDFIAAFQEIVTTSLSNDEDVTIAGFGNFSSRIRGARKGVNPRKPTEIINVPAVKVPKFKAGKALKDALKASMKSGSETPAPSAPETPSAE